MSSTHVTVLYCLSFLAIASGYSWSEKWLTGVPVDHFSFADSRTFSLRYLINKDHWKENGPILFYCGNEADIVLFANNTGFMWEIAPEFEAMVVFAEHRFYGKTLPFGNDSYSKIWNLAKLTSEQALADFAILLKFLKTNTSGASESKVIVFGGSYGGMLAAWFRIKYPHLVVGALASSAPIRQFQGQVPCWAFSAVVTRTFKISGRNCDNVIRKSWPALRRLGDTTAGRDWINDQFQLCEHSRLTDAENVNVMRAWLSSAWEFLAVMDYPYPTDFLEPVPAWPVKAACKHMSDDQAADKDLLQQIVKGISVYLNYTGQTDCYSFNDQATPDLEIVGWNYQACTEMVMPMCTNGTDMFEPSPWNQTAYASQCLEKFGVHIHTRPLWVPTYYGGRDLRSASNIIFSNGDLDPWTSGGVTGNVTGVDHSVHVIMIKNGAHHLDLRASHSLDTDSVKRARDKERAIIARWIRGDHTTSSAAFLSCPLCLFLFSILPIL